MKDRVTAHSRFRRLLTPPRRRPSPLVTSSFAGYLPTGIGSATSRPQGAAGSAEKTRSAWTPPPTAKTPRHRGWRSVGVWYRRHADCGIGTLGQDETRDERRVSGAKGGEAGEIGGGGGRGFLDDLRGWRVMVLGAGCSRKQKQGNFPCSIPGDTIHKRRQGGCQKRQSALHRGRLQRQFSASEKRAVRDGHPDASRLSSVSPVPVAPAAVVVI